MKDIISLYANLFVCLSLQQVQFYHGKLLEIEPGCKQTKDAAQNLKGHDLQTFCS